MPGKIFINPAGQRDNLGDSVLRRPYLDALREAGELHVLVGEDADYASGLGLGPSDVVYTSRLRWLSRALVSVATERSAFAMNAGEVVGGRSEVRRSAWQDVLSRLARVRRAPIVLAGVSVRPGHDADDTRLPTIARRADVVVWRDAWSRDAVGEGTVAPDWAFLEGADVAPEAQRPLLAVAMRGDRPEPSDEWFALVQGVCRELGCEPVVVVQVRRDADRAAHLASRLGASVIDWASTDDHAAQEKKIRSVYRRTRMVVSDRIHALILGVTEGAMPAGLTTDGSEKIKRTFGAFTSLPVASVDGMEDSERLRILADAQSTVGQDLARARELLESVSEDIGRVIASGRSDK